MGGKWTCQQAMTSVTSSLPVLCIASIPFGRVYLRPLPSERHSPCSPKPQLQPEQSAPVSSACAVLRYRAKPSSSCRFAAGRIFAGAAVCINQPFMKIRYLVQANVLIGTLEIKKALVSYRKYPALDQTSSVESWYFASLVLNFLRHRHYDYVLLAVWHSDLAAGAPVLPASRAG